jgi:hypothetical protein
MRSIFTIPMGNPARCRMLNPKYKTYVIRLRELIPEGERVVAGATGKSDFGRFVEPDKSTDLHAWITKVENILRTVFGEQSAHFQHYSKFAYDGKRVHLQNIDDIVPIIGILRGALDDLENGFLARQEFIVSAALFDDLLGQAQHLCENGYKDPAAVLARVILEDALRRLARSASIDDTTKVSTINDELKKAEHFTQPQWRQVQAWLDVGNAAAHGKFDQYTQDDVLKLIQDLKCFLATEYRSP